MARSLSVSLILSCIFKDTRHDSELGMGFVTPSGVPKLDEQGRQREKYIAGTIEPQ